MTCSRPEEPSGKAKVRSLVEMVGATMFAVRIGMSDSVVLVVWALLSYSGSRMRCALTQTKCNGVDDCAECRQLDLPERDVNCGDGSDFVPGDHMSSHSPN